MNFSPTSSKTTWFLGFLGLFAFTGLAATIIHKGRQEQYLYVVSAVAVTVEGVTKDVSFLHKHFKGEVTKLPASIESVILKPGKSLLDMIWLGEQVVKPRWHREYRNLKLMLENNYLHIHQKDDDVHYVLAGIGVKGLDVQQGGIVLQLTHVERDLVKLLESEFGDKLTHYPSTIPGTRDINILVYKA